MTWILVYQYMAEAAKAKKLADFLRWAIHDGQKLAAALDYAPLPPNVVKALDKRLSAKRRLAAR